MKRTIRFSLTSLVLFVLLSSFTLAVGVTAPYWKENPLTMNAGEEREITFTLQNMVGDEPVFLALELIKGEPYLVHLDNTKVYEVPAQTKGIPVRFKIIIPEGTKAGSVIPIEVNFATTSTAGSGELALGLGIGKRFDVLVGGEPPVEEKPKPEIAAPTEKKSSLRPLTKDDLLPALVVLIIVLIFWLVLQKVKIGKLKHNKGRKPPQKHAPW